MRISIIFALCCIALAGCKAKPTYYWGDYEGSLSATFKDPNALESVIADYEYTISEGERPSKKVPPGIYAELGTAYFQMNNLEKAETYYKKELATWPQSRGLMESMISNIQRQKSKSSEGEK